ncbi:hypothetical protein BT69DRAFT_1330463 [Atractiella rhizophila]|nr:hypothetical protein BT69DRAFT_1330463 [Atractiella rhizophila]
MTPALTLTVTYGSRPNAKVDAYVPAGAQGKHPTILVFHGGGIVSGDRGQNPIFPYWLADASLEKGWVFLSAGYSLLPKHTGYDILDDVQRRTNRFSQVGGEEVVPSTMARKILLHVAYTWGPRFAGIEGRE